MQYILIKYIVYAYINQSFLKVHVRVLICFSWIQSLIWLVFQARTDKLFGSLRNLVLFGWVWRKINFRCLQDHSFFVNLVLRKAMTKGSFSIEHFVENDPNWPYIDFWGNSGIIGLKCFRRQVPICPNSLWGQINFCLFCVTINGLAKSKIKDFDNAFMEDDVSRFQVIMNDFILEVVKIVEST